MPNRLDDAGAHEAESRVQPLRRRVALRDAQLDRAAALLACVRHDLRDERTADAAAARARIDPHRDQIEPVALAVAARGAEHAGRIARDELRASGELAAPVGLAEALLVLERAAERARRLGERGEA